MRILYVAMRYDYGRPQDGDSFEHCNFFGSLQGMGHEILYFDLLGVLARRGREGLNRRLLEIARSERPDLMFTVLFRDELDRKVVRKISDLPDTTTLNWFCDDHWRFDDYSRHWAPAFNWVVTTDSAAVAKYQAGGYEQVLKSQWACNHFRYTRRQLPRKYEVSFVGKPHGNRRDVIEALRDAGIRVHVWGHGWGHGRASGEQMIDIFNASRINLNLSNASGARRRHKWQRALGRAARIVRGAVGGSLSVERVAKRFPPSGQRDQIKGRNFEVPGCGGFLLTGKADNLSDYFEPGRELATFKDFQEMAEQIRYYLHHEEERAAIATAGYQRTLAEHTYVHRFCEIFQKMGLASASQCEATLARTLPGASADVPSPAPWRPGPVVEAA